MSPHLEPVRGMVNRVLRQRALAVETRSRVHDGLSAAIIEFLVKLQSNLNTIDGVFIAPSVFTSCPISQNPSLQSKCNKISI